MNYDCEKAKEEKAVCFSLCHFLSAPKGNPFGKLCTASCIATEKRFSLRSFSTHYHLKNSSRKHTHTQKYTHNVCVCVLHFVFFQLSDNVA